MAAFRWIISRSIGITDSVEEISWIHIWLACDENGEISIFPGLISLPHSPIVWMLKMKNHFAFQTHGAHFSAFPNSLIQNTSSHFIGGYQAMHYLIFKILHNWHSLKSRQSGSVHVLVSWSDKDGLFERGDTIKSVQSFLFMWPR